MEMSFMLFFALLFAFCWPLMFEHVYKIRTGKAEKKLDEHFDTIPTN